MEKEKREKKCTITRNTKRMESEKSTEGKWNENYSSVDQDWGGDDQKSQGAQFYSGDAQTRIAIREGKSVGRNIG